MLKWQLPSVPDLASNNNDWEIFGSDDYLATKLPKIEALMFSSISS